jgi:hypothetical protein
MNEELINLLRSKSNKMSPDQLVDLFAKNKSNVSQFEFIEYFKAAFPAIPLRILTEASTSAHIIGPDGLDAPSLNELLEPWLNSTTRFP